MLQRLLDLCISPDGKRNRKHEQRLLRNMGAHTVILDLLEIPYEKVNFLCVSFFYIFFCFIKPFHMETHYEIQF